MRIYIFSENKRKKPQFEAKIGVFEKRVAKILFFQYYAIPMRKVLRSV